MAAEWLRPRCATGIHLPFMFASVRHDQRGETLVPSPAGIAGFAGYGEVTPAASGSLSQTNAMKDGAAGSPGVVRYRVAMNVLGKREQISVEACRDGEAIAPLYKSQKVGADRIDMPFGELNEVECG